MKFFGIKNSIFCIWNKHIKNLHVFPNNHHFLGLLVLVIQFGLPLLISSLCYWSIGRIISRQIRKRHQQQVLLQDNQNRLEGRKHRSHRLVFLKKGFWWVDFCRSLNFFAFFGILQILCHFSGFYKVIS